MDLDDIKEDIDHNKELIRSYKKSLHALEVQAARFGIHVPVHIQIEIESIQEEIDKCEKILKA